MQRICHFTLLVSAWLGTIAPPAAATQSDWPSYNRTLTSERYSSLAEINARNVVGLKIVCAYDTKQETGFQTGLVQVDGALFATTEQDIFSIDPDTCRVNWRTRENIPHSTLMVNRGAAVMDGRIYRGTSDGRVLAYDEKTGRRVWSTTIADPSKGETVPASPIAWNGLVFVGNAGGDNKGVKGRMYALDAATGKIVWEFYLVPRGPEDKLRGPEAKGAPGLLSLSWKNAKGFPISGGATWTSYTLDPASGLLYIPGGNPAPDFVNAYRNGDNLFTGSVVVLDAKTGTYQRHFQIVRHDFHDWDESTAPVLFTARSGERLMAVAPKDGYLYGFDLASGAQLYRKPVTTISNADIALKSRSIRFCPGSQGGAEWNGPAYDVQHDTLLTGEVDWCSTVRTDPKGAVKNASPGQLWSGSMSGFGMDKTPRWAGWVTASDAATGAQKWQFRAPSPNSERAYANGRWHRSVRRHRRQFLRLQFGERTKTVVQQSRRGRRRRRRHLRHGKRPEDCGGRGHDIADLADGARDGQDCRAGLEVVSSRISARPRAAHGASA